ncbi:MAG: tubulin-like doman-containing protein [Deltaproteobacteria bacterium]
MPNPIIPTIVIGLGTTGLDVLKKLSELVFEEFGTYDPPFLRLICIDTAAAMDCKPNIRVIQMDQNIGNVIAEKERRPENKEWNEALDEWLMDDVRQNTSDINKGAGGYRALGRLAIWAFADKISSAFGEQKVDLSNNLSEATDFLKRHWDQLGVSDGTQGDLLDHKDQNVYVVGTLCGGTCSGGFIDLGYIVKRAFTGKEPIGIFLLPDSKQLINPNLRRAGANTYGALCELDYHLIPESEQQSRWERRLPVTASPSVTSGELPYKPCIILSGASDNGNTLDPDALTQVVALRIFLGLAGGLEKELINRYNSDLITGDRWKSLHLNRSQRLFSFGLSAVRWPKLRIAYVVSCRLALDVLKKWQTEQTGVKTETATKLAKDDVNALEDILNKSFLIIEGKGIGEYIKIKLKTDIMSQQAGTIGTKLKAVANRLTVDAKKLQDEIGTVSDRLYAEAQKRYKDNQSKDLVDETRLESYEKCFKNQIGILLNQYPKDSDLLTPGGEYNWLTEREAQGIDKSFSRRKTDGVCRSLLMGNKLSSYANRLAIEDCTKVCSNKLTKHAKACMSEALRRFEVRLKELLCVSEERSRARERLQQLVNKKESKYKDMDDNANVIDVYSCQIKSDKTLSRELFNEEVAKYYDLCVKDIEKLYNIGKEELNKEDLSQCGIAKLADAIVDMFYNEVVNIMKSNKELFSVTDALTKSKFKYVREKLTAHSTPLIVHRDSYNIDLINNAPNKILVGANEGQLDEIANMSKYCESSEQRRKVKTEFDHIVAFYYDDPAFSMAAINDLGTFEICANQIDTAEKGNKFSVWTHKKGASAFSIVFQQETNVLRTRMIASMELPPLREIMFIKDPRDEYVFVIKGKAGDRTTFDPYNEDQVVKMLKNKTYREDFITRYRQAIHTVKQEILTDSRIKRTEEIEIELHEQNKAKPGSSSLDTTRITLLKQKINILQSKIITGDINDVYGINVIQ